MAQFTLTWDNTDEQGNVNNINQRVSYRQKSLSGTWLTSGVTPSNDLDKTVTTATVSDLQANLIYQFKVEGLCTENGPTQNTNGIQEQIGFSCLVPTLARTSKTSTIIITTTGTDILKAKLTLKKSGDNSIVYSNTVEKSGNSITGIASNLISDTTYYWEVTYYSLVNNVEVASNDSNYIGNICGPYPVTTDAQTQQLVWVADQKVCEKGGGFGLLSTITGLSSPQRVWYDPVSKLAYVSDHDDPNGNVLWFNPATATSASDFTHSSKIKQDDLYNSYIDDVNKKIYFVGKNSNGLLVYDIATDTASVIAFGTNGDYSRTMLVVSSTSIYCNDGSTSIIKIDRASLTIQAITAISSIPNNSHFNSAVNIIPVGSRVYVLNNNNSTIGTIGVYDSTLTNNLSEIAITGAHQWSTSGYWQAGFLDPTSGYLYIGDIGSSRRIIIDTATNTVIDNRVIGNKSGKGYVQCSWTINPNTNDLIFITTFLDSVADLTPIVRTYLEDRTTHQLKRMYKNQTYTQLFGYPGTDKLIGTNRGITHWYPVNTGYATDGSIFILSNSSGIGNSGVQIVNTLKQVDANDGNRATGLTKNNIPSDTDYIAPTNNITDCPVAYGLDCPTDLVATFDSSTQVLEFEVSLSKQVKNNPAISKIQIYPLNKNTLGTEGLPIEYSTPLLDYYTGSFTNLSGLNYGVKIKYFDSNNIEIQSC